jgi:8-oxo-dGTP pyrophosphatase MutT (NUDIX family)
MKSPGKNILRFHAAGRWAPAQVLIHRIDSSWRANTEIERLVDDAWHAATTRPGVNLFDGPMCRLESWDASPDCLSLNLSDTTYKRFLGTNLTHPDLADRFGQAVLANPVGVSPALLTADGFMMMGRRNATVAYYPNRVHPFAGALDPADADPFAAVRRELAEELSFADAAVGEVYCTGIAEDLAIRQPELIFVARTIRTRQEVEAAMDETEHDATWSAPATAEAIEAAVRSDESFTPVAIAAMLLYGRLAFGGEFFRRLGGMVAREADSE